MEEMITRSFEIRETNVELREVSGIAVPYNDTIDIGGGWSERFEKGAVDLNSDVKLFRDHKEIIGKVTALAETDSGLLVRAKISETNLGNETLALVKDGAIRSFSVGFIPVVDEKQNNTIIRKKVDLKEVSLVPFPAYEKASVIEVREVKEEIMTEINTTDYAADIAELRNHNDELERRLDVLATSSAPVESLPQFRSFGEYVKNVATGNTEAIELHKRFTGGVLDDSILKPAWVTDVVRVVNHGRPTYNAFSSAALPASGMTLEYPLLDTDTTAYELQVAEGDELAFGKIALTSATADVKTYGGYTDMSRQVIERSSVAYVDAAFRAMAATYAKATNKVVKDALVAQEDNFNQVTMADYATENVVKALAESATKVNWETGLALEFILCSSDVFINLAKSVDGVGRPVLANVGNVDNTFGAINPVGLTGSILGLPIVVDPSLPTGSIYVGNSAALTTYESAGAPFRLSYDDITHLTRQFSVYGYLAVATALPKALVKIS